MSSLQSLNRRNAALASIKKQMAVLEGDLFVQDKELPRFKTQLKKHNLFPLRPKSLDIFQINMGYMCNQVCAHCHVDAGPDRKEIMTKETLLSCLKVIKNQKVTTVDLTGGAPEMNPHFRWFVQELYQIGVPDIIVRSNLTIIRANKKFYDLPDFFKKHNVHVVSSMPHWTKGKTDKQRGNGVFKASIEALQQLNALGYGMPDSQYRLDLVYNPAGAFLPTAQESLEKDFKKALLEDFQIHFHHLFAITNLPISRFLEYLLKSDNYEDYMYTLVEAFNPVAANQVMCTNTLSVSWDGFLYDCDFNQMLGLGVASPVKHIKDYDASSLNDRNIVLSQHCYGCTAGSGSSCQGTVV